MRHSFEIGVICVALAACAEQHELEVGYVDDQAAAGSAVKADEADLSEACPPDRQVALSLQGGCPVADNLPWAVSSLFGIDDAGDPHAPEDGMGGLCLYEWQGGEDATRRDARRLRRTLGGAVDGIAADCRVVAPLASPISDMMAPSLRSAFVSAINYPGDLAGTPDPVRVAVVDSSPRFYNNGTARGGNSGHGLTVGRIVRGMTCGPDGAATGACVGYVADHLAMPRLPGGRIDRARGGYYGYFTDAAISINAAVSAWLGHMNAPPAGEAPQRRLVINLSLGWEGIYGGAYDPALPVQGQRAPPVLAVHRAITRAVCHGALVIAAAGNDAGGSPASTGPMYPGGWEIAPAPQAADCAGFGLATDAAGVPPAVTDYTPLVHSVGGVDGADVELASTRVGGRPRLAAPAFQAVMKYFNPNEMRWKNTDPMSGTSAAAAVVSAAATLAWGYEPNLNGADVMALIYGQSEPIGGGADYCHGGSCAANFGIRRASLCSTLLAVCPSAGGNCPDPADFDCDPMPAAGAGSNATVLAALRMGTAAAATMSPVAAAGTTHYDYGMIGLCGGSIALSSAEKKPPVGWGVCPEKQLLNGHGQPWVSPQPGDDPCPDCYALEYTAGGQQAFTITMGIDSDYSKSTLTDATLTVDGYAAVDLDSYGVSSLTGGDVLKVTGVMCKNCDPALTPTKVTLSFEVDGNSSASSQLLVEPL